MADVQDGEKPSSIIKLDELNPIADFIKGTPGFQLILGAENIQSSFLIKKLDFLIFFRTL